MSRNYSDDEDIGNGPRLSNAPSGAAPHLSFFIYAIDAVITGRLCYQGSQLLIRTPVPAKLSAGGGAFKTGLPEFKVPGINTRKE
jgi:hypothetical protein